jgi:hypothetical protein
LVVGVGSYLSGLLILMAASSLFPPIVGEPSSDPRGRGLVSASDVGLGPFIYLLLGAVAAWLAWLWTDRKNWSVDLFVASPVFLVFAVLTGANYIKVDTLITRDTQAVLNVLLTSSGVAIVVILHNSMHSIKSIFFHATGKAILVFCAYAFIAIPLWYTISFLSWKLGAGELDSLDDAAKALGAAASLLTFLGLAWKDGHFKVSRISSD